MMFQLFSNPQKGKKKLINKGKKKMAKKAKKIIKKKIVKKKVAKKSVKKIVRKSSKKSVKKNPMRKSFKDKSGKIHLGIPTLTKAETDKLKNRKALLTQGISKLEKMAKEVQYGKATPEAKAKLDKYKSLSTKLQGDAKKVKTELEYFQKKIHAAQTEEAAAKKKGLKVSKTIINEGKQDKAHVESLVDTYHDWTKALDESAAKISKASKDSKKKAKKAPKKIKKVAKKKAAKKVAKKKIAKKAKKKAAKRILSISSKEKKVSKKKAKKVVKKVKKVKAAKKVAKKAPKKAKKAKKARKASKRRGISKKAKHSINIASGSKHMTFKRKVSISKLKSGALSVRGNPDKGSFLTKAQNAIGDATQIELFEGIGLVVGGGLHSTINAGISKGIGMISPVAALHYETFAGGMLKQLGPAIAGVLAVYASKKFIKDAKTREKAVSVSKGLVAAALVNFGSSLYNTVMPKATPVAGINYFPRNMNGHVVGSKSMDGILTGSHAPMSGNADFGAIITGSKSMDGFSITDNEPFSYGDCTKGSY